MKKLFLLSAIVIVAMTSCSKNEIIETPESQKAISFNAFTHKSTKASEATITTLQGVGVATGIDIVAYLNEGTATISSASDFFTSVLKFSDPDWDTTPTRYWPSTTTSSPATHSLSFFAYYPSSIAYAKNSYPTTMPTLTYTVADTYNSQIDVLGASALKATNVGGSSDEVTLTFNHLLAQINFAIKGDKENLKYKVSKLTIGGALGNVGTFTYSDANASAGVWAVTTDTKTYEYDATEFPADGYTSVTTTLKNAADGKALILMPQDLGTSANFIKVTYEVTDENDIVLLPSEERSVALSGSWENGKNYIYTITLSDGLNPIEYSVSVGTWTPENGTVTIL